MTEGLYFKATLENGRSAARYEPEIHYKLGMNIHPSPDNKSKDACGKGIHLAKTIKDAFLYVSKASEIYLAKPGVILGEDNTKIRCASCVIVKKLTKEEVQIYKQAPDYPVNPLCGVEWLKENAFKFTLADFDRLGLEVSVGDRKLPPITAGHNKKQCKEYMQVVKSY